MAALDLVAVVAALELEGLDNTTVLDRRNLSLTDSKVVGEGIAVLIYECAAE